MTISNSDSIIDSRDVIARIAELQGERETLSDELDLAIDCVKFHHDNVVDENGKDGEHFEYLRCKDELAQWDSENGEELAALQAFAKEGESISDWEHGETLIRDSHFEDYAQELADDIGAINSDAVWPNNCIDWERAARELQQDYTSIDFDGVTYWAR